MLLSLLLVRPQPPPPRAAVHCSSDPDFVPNLPPELEFSKQPLEQEFAAAAFTRPATTEALMRFLLGRWKVRRATTYTVGGISGRFEGEAEFEVFPHATRTLLSYKESGQLQPTDGQLPSSTTEIETSNQLMYDFSDPSKVDIFYDGSLEDRGEEAVLAGLRFVHSLLPETLGMTDHPAENGVDEYEGKWDINVRAAAARRPWKPCHPFPRAHARPRRRLAGGPRVLDDVGRQRADDGGEHPLHVHEGTLGARLCG